MHSFGTLDTASIQAPDTESSIDSMSNVHGLGSGGLAKADRPHKRTLLPISDEHGELVEGKAIVVFLNGDRYIGHMRAGRKHGRGMYVYADLATYRGIWDEDVLAGVPHPVTEDSLPVEVQRLHSLRDRHGQMV